VLFKAMTVFAVLFSEQLSDPCFSVARDSCSRTKGGKDKTVGCESKSHPFFIMKKKG